MRFYCSSQSLYEGGVLIRVKIRTTSIYINIFGNSYFEVLISKGSTFEDLLEKLISTYGTDLIPHLFATDGTTLLPHVSFMLNGRNIRLINGKKTKIRNGDELLILPHVSGG